MHGKRRDVLKAGLGATALFLPAPYAWVWAQSDGVVKLLKAPKVALVVGNGKYKDAPELKNAPNDAKAIGAALKDSGFGVTLKLDTGRDEMLEAIRAYVHLMEQKKHVGLFYFAGHGVQLAWRNYLLPIDAVIDKIDDVGKQSVDIARLMEGLTKASNPMNVIILDACRENPFGSLKGADHKGLSQMDAPNQTLLAYATSPGNVASDGDGANGLYTENLLREIKVPEAKIEDVFKRVRLGVRRKSNGAQIPWESTSLEEDFWFLPPPQLKKLSDDERDRIYNEQLAGWEKVKQATDPAPLEDFLRKYPSGSFSELAQLQLDRVLARQGEKKVHIEAAAGNPFTKGSAEANTAYKVGDSYTYKTIDNFTKIETLETRTVTQITDREVVYDSGHVTDLLGNALKEPDGRSMTQTQQYPLEYAIGKQWTSRTDLFAPKAGYGKVTFEARIVTRERITVPAGTFDAFRIEAEGYGQFPSVTVKIDRKFWMAPAQVRRPLAFEQTRKVVGGRGGGGGQVLQADRLELVSFKQS
jgi:hypothetical protein